MFDSEDVLALLSRTKPMGTSLKNTKRKQWENKEKSSIYKRVCVCGGGVFTAEGIAER